MVLIVLIVGEFCELFSLCVRRGGPLRRVIPVGPVATAAMAALAGLVMSAHSKHSSVSEIIKLLQRIGRPNLRLSFPWVTT